jgi:hypothetical protein
MLQCYMLILRKKEENTTYMWTACCILNNPPHFEFHRFKMFALILTLETHAYDHEGMWRLSGAPQYTCYHPCGV